MPIFEWCKPQKSEERASVVFCFFFFFFFNKNKKGKKGIHRYLTQPIVAKKGEMVVLLQCGSSNLKKTVDII